MPLTNRPMPFRCFISRTATGRETKLGMKNMERIFSSTTVRIRLCLFLTTCFFWGMVTSVDLNVYIIEREHLFHPCKIGRASYKTFWSPNTPVHWPMLSYSDASRLPYDLWPRKKKQSFGAWAILKFAGNLQIANNVRWQFYLWP